MDELTLHAMYATGVTGRIEHSRRRIEDTNLAVILGIVGIDRVIT